MEKRKKQIEVVPYDAEWPKRFEVERHVIESALKDNCCSVLHIGSTAVPGLAAKPKLDILAVVKSRKGVIQNLSRAGYDFRGDWSIPFKMGFSKRGEMDINLHVFEEGDPEIELNLIFRDYLRCHPEACKEYADLKFSLAADDATHYKAGTVFPLYTLRKASLIQSILKAADFSGLRLLYCAHYEDWEAYHRIREEQIFERAGVKYDQDHPTMFLENHFHFVLCKGTQVVSVAHVELLDEQTAVIRSIATDEPFKRQGYGSKLMGLLEKWVFLKERTTIKLHAHPAAESFYRMLGYADVEFDDPCISDEFVNLGKKL